MKFYLQLASATNAERYDSDVESEAWETIAVSDNTNELFGELVTQLNNEDINLTNSWLRLVRDEDGRKSTEVY